MEILTLKWTSYLTLPIPKTTQHREVVRLRKGRSSSASFTFVACSVAQAKPDTHLFSHEQKLQSRSSSTSRSSSKTREPMHTPSWCISALASCTWSTKWLPRSSTNRLKMISTLLMTMKMTTLLSSNVHGSAFLRMWKKAPLSSTKDLSSCRT